jgi:Chaperone of endosialidase
LDFRFSDNPTSAAPTTALTIEPTGGGIANTYAQNGLLGHLAGGTFGALSNGDKWIGIGNPVIGGAPSLDLYGNRTQWEGQAMIFAMRRDPSTLEKNAIVEWGNQGGSMDFRYINNPSSPTGFTQIMRLTNVGNAELGVQGPLPGYFEPKLAVNSNFRDGIAVRSNAGTGIDIVVKDRAGILVNVSRGSDNQGEAYGIQTQVTGAEFQNFGLYGIADDNTRPGGWKNNFGTRSIARKGTGAYGVEAIAEDGEFFNWAIYSRATSSIATSWNAAGYFDGDVWANNFFLISDRKVKKDIKTENEALATIMKLRPVNYTMNKGETNIETFGKKLQHGFIAQEVQEVLPELVALAKHPVYENGKMTKAEDILTVNYIGIIPLLTKAVQELRQEVDILKVENKRLQENAVVKADVGLAKGEGKEPTDYKLLQNIPNPFSGITNINYTIPVNERNATLLITDLSGKLLKQYKLSGGSNTLSVSAADTGKGILLYSLVANGVEIITRRMIVQ